MAESQLRTKPMATGGAPERKISACCISHLFHEAASKDPERVAVIHASGFAQTVGESAVRRSANDDSFKFDSDESACTPSPPTYEGDEAFTFSEVLCAVENLTCQLSRILDGPEDPYLVKTRSVDILNGEFINVSEPVQYPVGSIQQSTRIRNTPKIVGIYMEPSVEYIVSVLSVLRCGEAFMPLDPSWPKTRILSLLSSSRADLVIGIKFPTGENSFHLLDAPQWLIDEGSFPVLSVSLKENIEEQSHPSQLGWPCKSENLRSFCYLMYTSGSSGKPKGVCGTEIGLLNRFQWMQEMYPLHRKDIVLLKTAISFIDHMQEFLGAVLTPCTLVIPPFSQLKENMFHITDILQGYLISRLVAVPSLIRAVLPALRNRHSMAIQGSLKLLVLSGEVLQLSFCKILLELLPQTVILNLYGSTEVAGDCTYFDCKRLPLILETEVISSIPIGLPVSNCDVVLVGEDAPYKGEVCVGGLCVAAGYFDYPDLLPLSHEILSQEKDAKCPGNGLGVQHYFKTGDLAKKLPSGDLVFLGRKDRTIKINGQRVVLEEIESVFQDHPDVVDAAVLSREDDGEILFLDAHVVAGKTANDTVFLRSSLRNWLTSKLPRTMIPSRIVFTRSLPLTSSGKIDYLSLAAAVPFGYQSRFDTEELPGGQLIQVIQEVFADALNLEKFSVSDDFFVMGGDSLSAAYVCFQLGIQMKLLYNYPTPLRLNMAFLSSSSSGGNDDHLEMNLTKPGEMFHSMGSKILNFHGRKPQGMSFKIDAERDNCSPTKRVKIELNTNATPSNGQSPGNCLWDLTALHTKCSFSRFNISTHQGLCEGNCSKGITWPSILTGDGKRFMQERWKVNMGSCVDASPLVVFKGSDLFLFIGSHSHKFVCIDGKGGNVNWVTKLEGRIECSAAILDDFSQIVVGCYLGNIYFLQFSDGRVCWSFRTNGEVKSQPVVDKCRHLVWFGSYDRNLYAIDYRSYSCIYKLPCGGSIFGSPAIDPVKEKLYVASTCGRVTALEIKALSFRTLWKQDMGAPIFSSLSITHSEGNIICSMVDGTVAVLSAHGTIVWKANTGGPIFAGPCTSQALPAQVRVRLRTSHPPQILLKGDETYWVLVSSRDGWIYSFKMETGDLIWKHELGNPITSSPYIDEHSLVTSNISSSSDRFVCVCDSSGSICVLQIDSNAVRDLQENKKGVVQEYASFNLGGNVFSSPVMVGGMIFVGCRDDHVYCVGLEVDQ